MPCSQPAAKRPTSFSIGVRTFDPVRVGFLTDVPGFPRFNVNNPDGTPITGNSNAGHEFGANLSDQERRTACRVLEDALISNSKIASVAGRPAAVDREHVAVHVAVFGVRQEEHGHGDLIGRGGPAERDVVEHALNLGVERAVLAVKQLASPFGQRGTGGDAVDQNAMRAELEGHCSRQVDDARLGRDESTLEPQRDKAGDRRDVDDPARALEHA